MSTIPHDVLSEHFQQRLSGRKLKSAVFLTYQFDPGFFEQEVLPVLFDIPLSHAKEIRLVQLEDHLRAISGSIAVYFDSHGLISENDSARLDVRRIPIQHRRGIFHPKNVFLLVENEEPDEFGHHAEYLLVASMSANITRSGWWENVEVCHVEEVCEYERTRFKDDLRSFLKRLRKKAPEQADQAGIESLLGFLRNVEQIPQKSAGGALHTHFYFGKEPLSEFLKRTVPRPLRGGYLEVISPYFDDAPDCDPLEDLIDVFEPRSTRVFLPRSASGDALVREELYESVAELPDVEWGNFASEITQQGKSKDAGQRFVHAKVYRFFTKRPKREVCFVGSPNLTSPAHGSGGNVESGFLVEVDSTSADFWLKPDEKPPVEFQVRTEDEQNATSGGTPLNLSYHWDDDRAEVFWDAPKPSPQLCVSARGIELGTLNAIPSREIVTLDATMTDRIRELLRDTSLFDVVNEDGNRSVLLVQEEGMSHKPSLLWRLSAADILRYWALLTPNQRLAFLEAKAPDLALTRDGADLVTRAQVQQEEETIFDRFAGFFHAFGCLERSVREALEDDREKEANARLFGKKYDSLGCLLDRVLSNDGKLDAVDKYVLVLCAQQMCESIRNDHSTYWASRRRDAEVLAEQFKRVNVIREELVSTNKEDDFAEFLAWFDRWFLRRAEAPEVEA